MTKLHTYHDKYLIFFPGKCHMQTGSRNHVHYHVTSEVRNMHIQLMRSTHSGKYGPSISERLRVECVLGNMKIEMHTPFAGIILCRFKGTFSAHITTIQTKRPSDC
jgi:hypothetical protein